MRYFTILFFLLFMGSTQVDAQKGFHYTRCLSDWYDCQTFCGDLPENMQSNCGYSCNGLYNECKGKDVLPTGPAVAITTISSEPRYAVSTSLIYSGVLLEEEAIFPNPTLGATTLTYTSVESTDIKLSIMNISGKTVKEEIHPIFEGVGVLEFNLENLTSGMYFINISNGEFYDTFKVIKR